MCQNKKLSFALVRQQWIGSILIILGLIFPVGGYAEPTEFPNSSINWSGLFLQSGLFLGIEHAFRLGTEQGTRDGLKGPFWSNYLDAVGNYHGWADKDEFLVNFIGHPMEGSVANYIFRQNDPKFRMAEFGRNAAYWKGQLRSTAFAFAYSTQFELGPIVSEANIGHIQSYYPQQGFVDVVITPTAGLGWTVAEDVLDRYIVKFIESRTRNSVVRLLARGGLNPSRSFANAMRFKRPWHRDDRPGVKQYDPAIYKNIYASMPYAPGTKNNLIQSFISPAAKVGNNSAGEEFFPTLPLFEITFHADFMNHPQEGEGKGNLFGAGATGVINFNRWAGLVIDVSGYKMSSQGPNLSGDSLAFLFGPRFSYRPSEHYALYTDILVGGNKLWQEREYPERKPPAGTDFSKCGRPEADCEYSAYHDRWEDTSFAAALGVGMDLAINRVLAFRICNFQYVRTSAKEFALGDYSNMFRFSTGFIIRTGNW
jgi:hypothetical protein